MAKLPMLLKVNEVSDKKIYETLSACESGTNFVKNALFYYISHIERGFVVDRLFPYEILEANMTGNVDFNKLPGDLVPPGSKTEGYDEDGNNPDDNELDEDDNGPDEDEEPESNKESVVVEDNFEFDF